MKLTVLLGLLHQLCVIVTSDVGTISCSHPWERYHNMCLFYHNNTDGQKLWVDANEDCKSHGGLLVWIKSRSEHMVIRDFAKKYATANSQYYHVGLYKDCYDNLRWTRPSYYFGEKEVIYAKKYKYFHSNTEGLFFRGYPAGWPHGWDDYMCRRF